MCEEEEPNSFVCKVNQHKKQTFQFVDNMKRLQPSAVSQFQPTEFQVVPWPPIEVVMGRSRYAPHLHHDGLHRDGAAVVRPVL